MEQSHDDSLNHLKQSKQKVCPEVTAELASTYDFEITTTVVIS